jgi:hypothetical protein
VQDCTSTPAVVSPRDFGGPRILERRAKAPRPCLSCGKSFVTTVSTRLCTRCTAAAADALEGTIPEASTTFIHIHGSDL